MQGAIEQDGSSGSISGLYSWVHWF